MAEMVPVLDQYALAIVTINAESRVKVEVGPAKPESEQEGTVINRPHFWLRFPNASNDDIFETTGGVIRNRPYSQRPYWRIESTRIGNTREVAVEIVVDGKPTALKNILADGQVRELDFDVPIDRSSWIAARILPSSHTNPIFVIVSGKPMRPLRASAEWCLATVDQCWTQKAPKISAQQLDDARQAYDHAREVYRKLIAESDKQ